MAEDRDRLITSDDSVTKEDPNFEGIDSEQLEVSEHAHTQLAPAKVRGYRLPKPKDISGNVLSDPPASRMAPGLAIQRGTSVATSISSMRGRSIQDDNGHDTSIVPIHPNSQATSTDGHVQTEIAPLKRRRGRPRKSQEPIASPPVIATSHPVALSDVEDSRGAATMTLPETSSLDGTGKRVSSRPRKPVVIYEAVSIPARRPSVSIPRKPVSATKSAKTRGSPAPRVKFVPYEELLREEEEEKRKTGVTGVYLHLFKSTESADHSSRRANESNIIVFKLEKLKDPKLLESNKGSWIQGLAAAVIAAEDKRNDRQDGDDEGQPMQKKRKTGKPEVGATPTAALSTVGDLEGSETDRNNFQKGAAPVQNDMNLPERTQKCPASPGNPLLQPGIEGSEERGEINQTIARSASNPLNPGGEIESTPVSVMNPIYSPSSERPETSDEFYQSTVLYASNVSKLLKRKRVTPTPVADLSLRSNIEQPSCGQELLDQRIAESLINPIKPLKQKKTADGPSANQLVESGFQGTTKGDPVDRRRRTRVKETDGAKTVLAEKFRSFGAASCPMYQSPYKSIYASTAPALSTAATAPLSSFSSPPCSETRSLITSPSALAFLQSSASVSDPSVPSSSLPAPPKPREYKSPYQASASPKTTYQSPYLPQGTSYTPHAHQAPKNTYTTYNTQDSSSNGSVGGPTTTCQHAHLTQAPGVDSRQTIVAGDHNKIFASGQEQCSETQLSQIPAVHAPSNFKPNLDARRNTHSVQSQQSSVPGTPNFSDIPRNIVARNEMHQPLSEQRAIWGSQPLSRVLQGNSGWEGHQPIEIQQSADPGTYHGSLSQKQSQVNQNLIPSSQNVNTLLTPESPIPVVPESPKDMSKKPPQNKRRKVAVAREDSAVISQMPSPLMHQMETVNEKSYRPLSQAEKRQIALSIAEVVIIPNAFARIPCIWNDIPGNLVLSEEDKTLSFLGVDQHPPELPELLLPISKLTTNPSTSVRGSEPMELRINAIDTRSKEDIYRFIVASTDAAYKASNDMRAKLVTAIIAFRFEQGRVVSHGSVAAEDAVRDIEKPFRCEKCGAKWKNREGVLYHQMKSLTACNPNYVPTFEKSPRKRKIPVEVLPDQGSGVHPMEVGNSEVRDLNTKRPGNARQTAQRETSLEAPVEAPEEIVEGDSDSEDEPWDAPLHLSLPASEDGSDYEPEGKGRHKRPKRPKRPRHSAAASDSTPLDQDGAPAHNQDWRVSHSQKLRDRWASIKGSGKNSLGGDTPNKSRVIGKRKKSSDYAAKNGERAAFKERLKLLQQVWQQSQAFLPNPETGAWNQVPVRIKTRKAKGAVSYYERRLPEPITFMQTAENPAWNFRPFGHGVRPIYARPGARRAKVVKHAQSEFRPMLVPQKGNYRRKGSIQNPQQKNAAKSVDGVSLSPPQSNTPSNLVAAVAEDSSDIEESSELDEIPPEDYSALSMRSMGRRELRNDVAGIPNREYWLSDEEFVTEFDAPTVKGLSTRNARKRRGSALSSDDEFRPSISGNRKMPSFSFVDDLDSADLRDDRPLTRARARRASREQAPYFIRDISPKKLDSQTGRRQNPGLDSLPGTYGYETHDLSSSPQPQEYLRNDILNFHFLEPNTQLYEEGAELSEIIFERASETSNFRWIGHKINLERPDGPKPVKIQWLDENSFTLETLPYLELQDTAHTTLPIDSPRPSNKRRKTYDTSTDPNAQPVLPSIKRRRSRQSKKRDNIQGLEYVRESIKCATRRLAALPSDLRGLIDGRDATSSELGVEVAYYSTVVAPRRKDGAMTAEIETRLIVAVTVIRILAGGVETQIDWVLVGSLFQDFSMSYLQKKWGAALDKNKVLIEMLGQNFQDIFLAAYEAGEIPRIDYDHLVDYDWKRLVDWTITKVDTSAYQATLPDSRENLAKLYDFGKVETNATNWRETFYGLAPPLYRRLELASAVQSTITVIPRTRNDEVDDLTLAKSWARASTLTPDDVWNTEAASDKLHQLGLPLVEKAVKALLASKVIAHKHKGRAIPGRSYEPTDTFANALRKHISEDQILEAITFKAFLDAQFRDADGDGRKNGVRFDYMASDGVVMCVTNMQAYGRIKLVPVGAPNNKFGLMDGGGYETRKLSKEKFRFEMDIYPTSTYLFDSDNSTVQGFRDIEPPRGGNRGELPVWYDISDNLMPDLWMKVTGAVFGVISLRAGITCEGLAQNFAPALDEWEIRRLMEWGVRVGALERVHESLEGWTTSEWWWLVGQKRSAVAAIAE